MLALYSFRWYSFLFCRTFLGGVELFLKTLCVNLFAFVFLFMFLSNLNKNKIYRMSLCVCKKGKINYFACIYHKLWSHERTRWIHDAVRNFLYFAVQLSCSNNLNICCLLNDRLLYFCIQSITANIMKNFENFITFLQRFSHVSDKAVNRSTKSYRNLTTSLTLPCHLDFVWLRKTMKAPRNDWFCCTVVEKYYLLRQQINDTAF